MCFTKLQLSYIHILHKELFTTGQFYCEHSLNICIFFKSTFTPFLNSHFTTKQFFYVHTLQLCRFLMFKLYNFAALLYSFRATVRE